MLVSQRFSTVCMADVIVVLGGARIVEAGSCEELMAAPRGLYAVLYDIQARAYRRRTDIAAASGEKTDALMKAREDAFAMICEHAFAVRICEGHS